MLNAVAPSSAVFKGVANWTRTADLATANLEIPLTDSRTPTARKSAAELKAKTQFVLKADPRHAPQLAAAGFDLVSLGNNHAMDYGPRGLAQMTAALDRQKIAWCGAGKDAAQAVEHRVVKLKNGLKVAFLSFHAFQTPGALWKCTPATASAPGVATLAGLPVRTPATGQAQKGTARQAEGPALSRRLKTAVASARQDADVVVVWLHWGTERKTVPNPYQVQLGRKWIEAGADCVLGAHPHVLQGAEIYAGRPVFYSLGNLVSPLGGSTGLFRLTFEGRTFQKAEMLPCAISGGAVNAVPTPRRAAGIKAFRGLCDTVVRRFRNSKSGALTVE